MKKHYTIAFWLTLATSIGLIVGGFFAPPMGEINGTILTGVGELFLWPALAFGAKALEENHKVTFQKGDTNITIDD